MMYLKECPKCHGDLVSGEDIHGQFMSCVQCGYLRDLPSEDKGVEAPYADQQPLVIEEPKTRKKRQKKVRQAA